MKYAKMLEGVLRLFPRRIKVTFIHAVTGLPIGKYKMNPELLPEKFNKPITIETDGTLYRVLKANPVKADDFLFTKKLTLHVQENDQVDPAAIRLPIATAAYPQPGFSTIGLYNDFMLDLLPNDWRQIEFLPASMLPVIQEEMAIIEPILFPKKGGDRLLGYDTTHIRKNTGAGNHAIPLEAFCTLAAVKEKGVVRFSPTGFIQDGVALCSDNYVYYGTVQDNRIKDLCLHQFDCADDELFTLLTHFDLVLVDWCGGRIMTGEVVEKEPEESIAGSQESGVL